MSVRDWIRREREGLRDLLILAVLCLGIILVLAPCRMFRGGEGPDLTYLGVKHVYEKR